MEWKLRLPRDDRIATTLAAFANGCGGTVIVGVRDSGEVQGVHRPAQVESELRRVSTELVDPPIKVELSRRSQDSKAIVLARVRPSPVLVAVLRGPERILYVRDGSSTRKATTAEAALLARGPSARVRLDRTALRLLTAVTSTNPPTVTAIAKAVKMGQRGARRVLVRLMQAGLIMERGGGRFWLTPRGPRCLK
jgi:predicted HTH transcriptional regulator